MRSNNLPVVAEGTWVYDDRLTRAIRIVQSILGQEWDGHDNDTGEYLSDEEISRSGFDLNRVIYVVELEATVQRGTYSAHGEWGSTIDEAKQTASDLPGIGHTVRWNRA